MDHIVINHPEQGERIARAAGVILNPRADQVIAREKDGELLGGVVLTNFTRASITAHFAGFDKRWGSRDLLWCVFHYCFTQLGVGKIFGPVQETNEHALKVLLKIGFVEEVRVKDVFTDGDLVVVSMRRDQCRWLGVKPRNVVGGQ